jgi:UDP-N-acetyl-D-glucosamine/UDP-N-acetyl-D-galactosamine dehydrogenase
LSTGYTPQLYQDLLQKKARLAVIGLGYVGLPVALAFAKRLSVIGFDINEQHVQQLGLGADPGGEMAAADFSGTDIVFTSAPEAIREARFFLVAVPTPVDTHKVPDLAALKSAAQIIGLCLKKGDCVVFESTVYPGCTEEICLPLIEKASGLQCGVDFNLGYSPERINPGDKQHTLRNTVKIVAGFDTEALLLVSSIYELIIDAGVYRATNIKTAEAAKIIENTQRDVNISLMNELSVIFDKLGINTLDVLDAASTKWNFVRYTPGLVGGHCINVDPYYLTHKAAQVGYHSKVIAAGRFVNDDMPHYVSKKLVQHIIRHTDNKTTPKVLVLGATFKENVNDIRNSKVAELVKDLLDYSVQVDFVDEHADAAAVYKEYGLTLAAAVGSGYDAIVLAVAHDRYSHFSEDYLVSISKPHAMFADLKGIYRNRIKQLMYWSL